MPTEMLCGLKAVPRMQGRAASAPLAVSVGEPAAVAALAETGHLPAGLLPALLPGPVTLLLSRRSDAPLCAQLNPGVATVGARPQEQAE